MFEITVYSKRIAELPLGLACDGFGLAARDPKLARCPSALAATDMLTMVYLPGFGELGTAVI